MDLNQAEVAVTTQHLIDTRQEKDNWLQMSDFGDMGEFLCTCSELFAEEETPEYRYMKWEDIPTHSSTWNGCAPTFLRYGKRWNSWKNPTRIVSSTGVTATGMTSVRKMHTCWWRITSNFSGTRPIPVMSHARTAGMTACRTTRAYQAITSTRAFPHFEVFDDNYD